MSDPETIVRLVGGILRPQTPKETDWRNRFWRIGDPISGVPINSGPEEVELVYIKLALGRSVSIEEAEQMLDARGLKPDQQAQIADNSQNEDFSDKYPNILFWDHRDGHAEFVAYYYPFEGHRGVMCASCSNLPDGWWIAGVHK